MLVSQFRREVKYSLSVAIHLWWETHYVCFRYDKPRTSGNPSQVSPRDNRLQSLIYRTRLLGAISYVDQYLLNNNYKIVLIIEILSFGSWLQVGWQHFFLNNFLSFFYDYRWVLIRKLPLISIGSYAVTISGLLLNLKV